MKTKKLLKGGMVPYSRTRSSISRSKSGISRSKTTLRSSLNSSLYKSKTRTSRQTRRSSKQTKTRRSTNISEKLLNIVFDELFDVLDNDPALDTISIAKFPKDKHKSILIMRNENMFNDESIKLIKSYKNIPIRVHIGLKKQNKNKRNILSGGIQIKPHDIENGHGGPGSIGCILKDKKGEKYILTNQHVTEEGDFISTNNYIPQYSNDNASNLFFEYWNNLNEDNIFIGKDIYEIIDHDIGLVKLHKDIETNGIVYSNQDNSHNEINGYLRTDPKIDTPVIKYGQRSGKTEGVIITQKCITKTDEGGTKEDDILILGTEMNFEYPEGFKYTDFKNNNLSKFTSNKFGKYFSDIQNDIYDNISTFRQIKNLPLFKRNNFYNTLSSIGDWLKSILNNPDFSDENKANIYNSLFIGAGDSGSCVIDNNGIIQALNYASQPIFGCFKKNCQMGLGACKNCDCNKNPMLYFVTSSIKINRVMEEIKNKFHLDLDVDNFDPNKIPKEISDKKAYISLLSDRIKEYFLNIELSDFESLKDIEKKLFLMYVHKILENKKMDLSKYFLNITKKKKSYLFIDKDYNPFFENTDLKTPLTYNAYNIINSLLLDFISNPTDFHVLVKSKL